MCHSTLSPRISDLLDRNIVEVNAVLIIKGRKVEFIENFFSHLVLIKAFLE